MAEIIPFERPEPDAAAEDEAARPDLTAKTLKALRTLAGMVETCVSTLEEATDAAPPSDRNIAGPKSNYVLPPAGAPISQAVRSLMRRDWHKREQLVLAAKYNMQAAGIRAGWAFRDSNWCKELKVEAEKATLAYTYACLDLMLTPAWDRKGLAWKLKHEELLDEHKRWWRSVLTADKARLACRATRPDRRRGGGLSAVEAAAAS